MEAKMNWSEKLFIIATSVGVIGVTAWINMMAISVWWSHNWWWVVGIIALATSKWWFTPMWRAYLALADHVDMIKIRQQHYLMLAGATSKMEQGFDTTYKNAVHGFEIGVHNPYTKSMQIQAKPEQAQIEGPVVPQAPHFAQMKHLITKKKMPLCFLADGPAYGTVNDLLSMAITGKPGRGKTTALMYYVCMLLANGADVFVWDPHGAMNELAVLNGKVLPNMPETAKLTYLDRREDIINSVPVLQAELAKRDDLYRDGHQTRHPLLILADELPVLADYDASLVAEHRAMNKKRVKDGDDELEIPSLITLIRRFVLEARKWNCYFIGSGQSMDAQILPTKVTENMSSRIVFFSSDRRARMSGLENDAIKKYLPLIRRAGSGVMVFDCARWDEPAIGAIPMIEVDDMLEYLGVDASPFSQEYTDFELSRKITGELVSDVSPLPRLSESNISTHQQREEVEVSQQETQIILGAAYAQLEQSGQERVNRSRLVESLNKMDRSWNNKAWSKIKQVLDEEGL